MALNLPRCEHCDIDLHGKDVVYADGDARCRRCNNPVFLDDARHKRSRRKKDNLGGVPQGVSVEKHTEADGSETLRVRVPWSMQRPDDGLNLTGWIVVAAVVLGGIEFGLSKPIAFAAGTFLLLCFSGLRRINETSIYIRPTLIRISHGPIPWVWKNFDPRHIEQLYVARRPIAQHVFDYCVRARLDDDQDVSFFKGLREPAVAFYLEHCIEQHFNIEDRQVRGEYVQPPPPEPQSPYLD